MMRTRILYIIKLYLAIVTIFIAQKTVFMMADAPEGNDYGVAQWMEVITNGLLLDVPMTGYIVALPLMDRKGDKTATRRHTLLHINSHCRRHDIRLRPGTLPLLAV